MKANKQKLDKGLLFGNQPTGELIDVTEGAEKINVDGAEFEYGNIDRNRWNKYAVPRYFPTHEYYPHSIGNEGFWHPSNDIAKATTRREG